jgi:hypothetical protein
MQHPIRVARELSKFGYKINVSTEYDGLDLAKQEELKAIGIESAKEERIKKESYFSQYRVKIKLYLQLKCQR